MQKRQLAKTGIQVSVLGLGTVKFGRNQGVKYPRAFVLPDDKTIVELLALAADLGVNLLDTAPAYGVSEERLGKALAGARKQWVIATKAGEEFIDGASQFDFSAPAITHSVERSLQRLRTDYVDMVLVHSNGDDLTLIERDDVFSTLEQLKQQGKLRAYGMSSKTIAGGKLTLERADVAMVAFNTAYTDEREVLQHALQLEKSILIKKAFASGHLPAEESLPFVLNEPGVTSVIIGTLDSSHLRKNAALALSV